MRHVHFTLQPYVQVFFKGVITLFILMLVEAYFAFCSTHSNIGPNWPSFGLKASDIYQVRKLGLKIVHVKGPTVQAIRACD